MMMMMMMMMVFPDDRPPRRCIDGSRQGIHAGYVSRSVDGGIASVVMGTLLPLLFVATRMVSLLSILSLVIVPVIVVIVIIVH
jgi:hypothetical protein